MKRIFPAVVMLFLMLTGMSFAEMVWYHPMPTASIVPQDKHNIMDGWITNVYYNRTFVQDQKLQIGGWGDTYRTYVKFNTEGMPKNVDVAALYLYCYPKGDNSTLTGSYFYLVNGNWNNTMAWDSQPSATYLGWRSGPSINNWWATGITPWYNSWTNDPSCNYGLRIDPWYRSNNFDLFASSRYEADRFYTPWMYLDFTPSIKLATPLPGNLSWLLTVEIGGYDCNGGAPWPDTAHQGENYFALDFSWQNINNAGQPVYGHYDDIPVLAAADGKIAEIGDKLKHPNGYYVVINHTNADGSLNGFSTRYLHLKTDPSYFIPSDKKVKKGDQIGIMGTTGEDSYGNPTSTDIHLHFGVRYNGSGASNIEALTKVVMDGQILKGFQTKCDSFRNRILYYKSLNRVYKQ